MYPPGLSFAKTLFLSQTLVAWIRSGFQKNGYTYDAETRVFSKGGVF
jgi:hypothetical protein